ncbi:MAG: FAD binding domain-containing protein [Gemmatimonadales bacterium]
MPTATFLKAHSLAEALTFLDDTTDSVPLAGGTDLMVMLHARSVAPAALVDIWSLKELKGIRETGDAIVIGAAESYTAIIRSPLVQQHLPALAEVAQTIGAAQIQNRGTLGGNLANASPAGDTLPFMLAADAVIVTDRREIPVTDFFTSYRQTVLQQGELIVSVRFPRDGRNIRFRKVGTRQAQAISKVVIAVCREPSRIAIGSVAEVPLRAASAEAALERGDITGAVAAVERDIRPQDDVRSSAEHRRRVTSNVLRQLLVNGAV